MGQKQKSEDFFRREGVFFSPSLAKRRRWGGEKEGAGGGKGGRKNGDRILEMRTVPKRLHMHSFLYRSFVFLFKSKYINSNKNN